MIDSTQSGLLQYWRNHHNEPVLVSRKPYINTWNSQLKDYENMAIGHDVVKGIHAIFEIMKKQEPQIKTIGVYGIGNTGRNIASQLVAWKEKNGLTEPEIIIYDRVPDKTHRKGNRHYGYVQGTTIAEKPKNILEKSDLIISCTGKNPYHDKQFSMMKDGCFWPLLLRPMKKSI